jgi:hypothetical protein
MPQSGHKRCEGATGGENDCICHKMTRRNKRRGALWEFSLPTARRQ